MPQVIPYVAGAFKATSAYAAGVGFAPTLMQVLTVTAVKVAATLGLSYVASKLSSSKYDTLASLTGRMQNVRSTAQPRLTLYGKLRVGGQLAFVGNSGTDNEFLWLVLVHAAHEVHAIDKYYINGEVVPMTGTEASSGNRFNGHFWAYPHLGTDGQAADANLVAAFPGQWTSNHRLRGCAYTVFKLKWNNEENVWPNGIPVLTAEIRGKKVWDFRDGSYKYTANWALCVADYIMANRGAAVADFAASEIAAAANLSDESVGLTGGGSEARYELHGAIPANEDPEQVIDKMRSAGMGFISETGGFWTIHAGGWRAPEVTLVADDFHGPISVTTRQSISEGGNGVRGVFANGAEKYVPMEFPAVENAAYLSEDNGIRRWIDLNLEYTTSSAMAQRLAKIALEEARQQIAISAVLSNRGMRLRAGDVVWLTLPKFGWTAKAFEVHSLELIEAGEGDAPALLVEVALREAAPGVYDWANGEETTVDLAPNTTLRNAWEVPAPVWGTLESGGDHLLRLGDGTVVSQIFAPWSFAGDATVSRFEVEYRGWDLNWPYYGYDFVPLEVVGGSQRQVWVTDVIDDIDYELRIRAVNALGIASPWVVSPPVRVVGKTEPPGAASALSIGYGPRSAILSWTNPADKDLRGVEVWRHGPFGTPSFAGATKVAETLAGAYVDTDLPASGPGTMTYYLRAVDTSGNLSGLIEDDFYIPAAPA